MISKGAQYLTAAGFGNIRVTAASMGPLDILGTFSWLKSAAVRAIIAAFGADGAAVINATNAYLNGIAAQGAEGKSKAQALAALINEDPMMVCSLGLEVDLTVLPKMPIRLILGSASNYGIAHIYGTNKTRVIFKGMLHADSSSSQSPCPFGSEVSYNDRAYDIWLLYGNDTVCYNNGYRQGMGATPKGTLFTIDGNNNNHWTNVLDNGTTKWDVTFSVASTFQTPNKLGLLTAFRNGNCIFSGNGTKIYGASWIFYEDGNLVGHYLPIKRNGVMEIIDLVTENICTKVGQFTESFGYMQNGQWVTWTPSTP